MLMIENVSLHGELHEIVQEPPRVVIEVYDDDAVVRKTHLVLVGIVLNESFLD